MRKIQWVVLLLAAALMLFVGSVLAQDPLPDTDGDSIADEFDSCPNEAGLLENSGCPAGVTPDFDQDGVPDFEDYCYNIAGTPELRGCTPETFPDFDQDGIADPEDSCYDQAGTAENFGCPEGVIADYDFDGVPDSEDACRFIYGDAAHNGCMPDADGDQVEDSQDACPNEAGTFENLGCPEGVAPPDGDGDGLADLRDSCPLEAGPIETSGCPDTDGDLVADLYDSCPDVAGEGELGGCQRVTEISLPSPRTPISLDNASQLAEVGSLVVGPYNLAVNQANTLLVQSRTGISIYDLNTPELSPRVIDVANSGPFSAAVTSNAFALGEFVTFDGVPLISLWDAASGEKSIEITSEIPNFNNVYLSPDGTRILTVHYADELEFSEGITSGNIVVVWNASDNTEITRWAVPGGLAGALFSPDGSLVVAANGVSGTGTVWSATDGSAVFTIEAPISTLFGGSGIRFSPDGTKLAVALADGSITIYDVPSFTQTATLTVTDRSLNEGVTSLAFSPDGSVLAVGIGDVFFEGAPAADYEPTFAVRIANATSGEVLAELGTETSLYSSPYFSLTFNPTGDLLIATRNYPVVFWGIPQ